ncbi:dethiobiotin synthase [Halioxenophilus sp. WMMB6]|uniref:dethiobiotin synthase n=1 Tax=Halioxenophilus sp. WMMB6 TaxID=3073815 RepID=UPI00295F0E09|nr:dethiobiotin synthase [Halioxenophilus sp. WMMB6]
MASSRKKFFVTGTDTEVGKTFISCALLTKARQQGLTTGALKPLAAGCEEIDGQWQNDDARALQAAMTLSLPYQTVNPIALKAAIAPHIAAAQEGKRLQVARLEGFVKGALTTPADLWLVEGAGGWLVPLNPAETLADLAKSLELPVIMVVAMRLGCINHALLTAQAIKLSGLPLAGWVANCVGPQSSVLAENIGTLRALLPAPLLGVVPRCDSVEAAAEHLSLEPLLASTD